MSLKKQLIKIGARHKELRPHIRPVLAELGECRRRRTASKAIYEQARPIAEKALQTIHKGFNKILDDAKKQLAKQDLEMNTSGRGASWLDFSLHGSDGLLVGGRLHLTDKAEYPRTKEEVEKAVVASGVTDWAYVTRGDGAGKWDVEIGDSDRI